MRGEPEGLFRCDLKTMLFECQLLLDAMENDKAYELDRLKEVTANLQQSIATLEGEVKTKAVLDAMGVKDDCL